MVISLRYFIITIIAIFLSLGIGIFIGAIMDSQHLFIEQQKQLVSQIEDEFDNFKEKNYELLTKVENYKKERENEDIFINNAYNYLIQDSLKDLNILILNLSDEEIFTDTFGFLKESGANNVFYTTIDSYKETNRNINERKSSIEIMDKDNLQIMKKDLNEILYNLNEKKNKSTNIINEINSSLNYIIVFDGIYNSEMVAELGERKVVINMLKQWEIPLIVAEKTNTFYSSIPVYKEFRISSVDNIDTHIGKISMILLIKGSKGNYGEKKTADKLMPSDFSKLK